MQMLLMHYAVDAYAVDADAVDADAVDADAAVASGHRMRRNKSSSSSLTQMSDSRETLGEVVHSDCSTWGSKGLHLPKFGWSSQLQLLVVYI